jgi:hypothetical protein
MNANGGAMKAEMTSSTETFADAESADARICGVRRIFHLRWA